MQTFINFQLKMAAKKTPKRISQPSNELAGTPAPAAKKTVKKAARKTTRKSVAPAADAAPSQLEKAGPTAEAIAHAAYLIYLRRKELGLPGDAHGDWLEAELQFH